VTAEKKLTALARLASANPMPASRIAALEGSRPELATLLSRADEEVDLDERAPRAPSPRARHRLVLAAVVLALLIAGSAFALGLPGVVLDFGASEKPAATAPVVKDFASLDEAAPPGMATGVIAGETRTVASFPVSDGDPVTLWVAPTKDGGFCVAYSRGLAGGCDRNRTVAFSRGLSIPGRIVFDGEQLQSQMFLSGWALPEGSAAVEVQFADGESTHLPLLRVSRPIDAGFFVYEVPAVHRSVGHFPTGLAFQDDNGAELGRVEIPSILPSAGVG
jgi:hypothetical protein